MPESSTTIKSPGRSGLTALVGGAAGFIGSQLCEALLNQNIKIIGVDNLVNSSRENIKELITNPHFTFFDFDLNNNKFGLGEEIQIDYVFHVAGVGESLGEKDLSLETLLVNSLGTKHLLDLAREKKAKFLLVSSADIYSGALSSTSLNYYFGRFKRDERLLTHHEAKRYAEALTFEYFKKYDVNARICRLLDTYGPKMDLNNGSTLSKLIKEALSSDRLTIEGDGLETLHPTFVSDVIYGLIKAMLAENTKGKIFQLINPEKTTVLALVDEFKKAFAKNYDLQFKNNDHHLDFPYHTLETDSNTASLNWRPGVRLIDGLIKTAASFQNKTSPTLLPPTAVPLNNNYSVEKAKKPRPSFLTKIKFVSLVRRKTILNRRRLKFTVFLASVALLLLGVLYPITSFFLSVGTASSLLQRSHLAVNSRNFTQAQILASQAETGWRQASGDLNNLNWLLTLLQMRARSAGWEQSLFTLADFSKALSLATGSVAPLELLAANWQNPQPNFHDYFLNQLLLQTGNLALAADQLAVAEASLNQAVKKETGLFTSQLQNLQVALPNTKKIVSGLRDAVVVLPDELGFNGPKTYLVLQTSNHTLKSSGGQVTDYLLATLENGHLSSTTGGKIDNLEKRVAESGTWPPELKDLKKTTVPTLTDSLWDLDQRVAVKTINNYFAGVGQDLAGVILADNSFWDEVKTISKIYPRLDNFKDWSTSLTTSDWERFLTVSLKSFKTKHLLAILDDEKGSSLFTERGFSGALLNQKIIGEKEAAGMESVSDYLLVNIDDLKPEETNITVVKDYQLVVSNQGLLTGKLTLKVENKNNTGFDGYLRLLVPGGSVLESVTSDDKPLPQVTQKGDKTKIGLPLKLTGPGSKTLVFSYQLPFQISRISKTTYSLIIQKQAGVVAAITNLQINWPAAFNTETQKPLEVIGNNASAIINQDQDQTIFLKFKPAS